MKDITRDDEEGRKRKCQCIATISGGIPRSRNLSKATVKRKIYELISINREGEKTSKGKSERPIHKFRDNEKVGSLRKKYFPW